VISPTLSMAGAAHDIDCARATLAKTAHRYRLLTKAIFSARSLKICSMRGPRLSQVESFVIDFHLAVGQHLDHYGFVLEFLVPASDWDFGCGTNVSRPFGVSGVITMKMIRSTSKMSMSGTTFHFRHRTGPYFHLPAFPLSFSFGPHP